MSQPWAEASSSSPPPNPPPNPDSNPDSNPLPSPPPNLEPNPESNPRPFADQPWQPANHTEQVMAQAMTSGDSAAYFRALVLAELYLPQVLGDAAEQRLLTATLFGQTFLLAFTSVDAMAAQTAGAADGYTVSSYAELRRKWPDPRWRLAVNVGSPIDAYVPIDVVQPAALAQEIIPSQAEAVTEAWTRAEASPAIDVDGFVEALLDAVVLVPTSREVDDPYDIMEPDFPWMYGGPPEDQHVEIFTSAQLLGQAYAAPVPSLSVAFALVASVWPPGFALSLNPHTDDSWQLPGEHVPLLLLWGGSDSDDDSETITP